MAESLRQNKKVIVPMQASPGKLYQSIAVDRPPLAGATARLEKPQVPRFVGFCKWCYRSFPAFGGTQKNFAPEYKDAIDFLGWELKPQEFTAAISFTLIIGLVLAFILGIFLVAVPFIPNCDSFDEFGEQVCESQTVAVAVAGVIGSDLMAMVYLAIPLLAGIFGAYYYVQRYPLNAAHDEQIKALTYVPEIVGYMTMSMKLVPNLEKAVEFAAQHGRGKIAEDFKKMIWDVQLGVYNSLSEALDALAYRWGKFSDEFKRSLMMVRASVLEDSESKRYSLLDKTMSELLESVKNKMETYARELNQPATFLFYLGVLLPLILIIILPIGSAFSGQPLARADVLIFIYNILIPVGAWFFARSVITKRPPTYESPVIPDSHPELPPKWKMKAGNGLLDVRFVILIVLVAGLGASFYLSTYGIYLDEETPIIPHDKSMGEVIQNAFLVDDPNYFEPGGTFEQRLIAEGESDVGQRRTIMLIEKQKFLADPENDVTSYNFIFGTLITLAGAIALALYYRNIYKRQLQQNVGKMETEFRDSLYILASRMGENKPVEEALEHTRRFLPNTLIAERIYGKTVDNIHILGLPLESALFDRNYGALKNLSSNIIVSSMKLLVDSVQLGVNVGARTLISLSLQLTNAEKVSRLLITLVQDITSTMQTTAIFIAPVILGVTTSLQKVVIQTLLNIAQDTTTQSPSFSGINNPGLAVNFQTLLEPTKRVVDSLVSPGMFIWIVAIYVVEIVFIMTYFNTKIQEDNETAFRINFAKALPVAIIVFIISVFLSNTIVGVLT